MGKRKVLFFNPGPCCPHTLRLTFLPSGHASSFFFFLMLLRLGWTFKQTSLGGDAGPGEDGFCQPQVILTMGYRQNFRFREERTAQSLLIRFQQDSKKKRQSLMHHYVMPWLLVL